MPYIGQRPSKGDENNFKILDDISSYTLTFDGSDSSIVSAANDTITSLNHRFVQGQRVLYHHGGGGSNIGGLGNNTPYFVIKEDHNTIKLATTASNASNGVAINITGVGGGSSHTLNIAFDGVNTKFKATHTNGQKAKITRSAQLVISINGVIQQPHDTATPSTGFGFDLDGTIVFSQAPVATDEYWAHVLTNNNVTFDISDNDIDNFTGDGSTTEFNLSKSPPDNRNVLVTIDGVVQYPNDPDGTARAYVVVENVLTFNSAPDSGVEIQVRHIGFAGSTSGSGGVTNFYGRTGSVVLKDTDNISVNDAAVTGDLTVTGNMTVNGDFTTLNTTLREVELLKVDANSSTTAGIITQRGSGDILNLFDNNSEVLTVTDGGQVGINSTSPSNGAILDIGVPTTKTGGLDSTVSIASTDNKTYPTAESFNVTLGLKQEIEVGGTQTLNPSSPGGYNFITGITNWMRKRNGNVQDVERSYYAGLNQNFFWNDENTLKQYTGISDSLSYFGNDANGRTTNYLIAKQIYVQPGAGKTATINRAYGEEFRFQNFAGDGGTPTTNVTHWSGFRPALNWFLINANYTGTMTEAHFYDTSHTWGVTVAGSGAPNYTITNLYGLRLRPPGNSTGLTITNNYGISQEWSSAKNYFAGKVGVGSAIPAATVDIQAVSSTNPVLNLGGGGSDNGDLTVNSGETLQVGHFNRSTSSFEERLRITPDGKLGIGTDNPDTQLEVFGGSTSIQVGNQSGSGRFGADGTSTKLGSHSNHHLDLFTNGASNTRIRITSGGEVLIGTTTDANVKLDVEGSLRAKSAGYVAPASGTGLEIYYATNTLNDTPSGYLISYDRSSSAYKKINYDASEHKFRTSGTEKLRVGAGGTVSISQSDHAGAQTLGADLVVADTTGASIIVGDTGSGEYLYLAGEGQLGRVGTKSNHDLVFHTNGESNERLRIKNTGQVQIHGTGNNPLKVTHTGADAIQLWRGSKYLGVNANWGGNTGNSVITVSDNLVVHTNGSNERLRITSAGYVGIQTADPKSFFHASRPSTCPVTLNFGDPVAQIFQCEDSEFALGLHNASPFPLFIQGRTRVNTAREIVLNPLGGNIGIGTINPTTKLDVRGGSILVDAFNTSGDHGIFFRAGFIPSSNPYNVSILAVDHNGANKDGLSINAYDGISFCTGSNTRQERVRIDLNGRLHTGYTTGFGNDHVNILASDGGGISIAQNNSGNATSGTVLGSLSIQGYLNTQTHTNAEVKISGIAAANHTGSSAATDMVFYTKPSTTGPGSAPTERLRITSLGKLLVGVHTSSDYTWSPRARFAVESSGDASSIHLGLRAAGGADPAIMMLRRGGSSPWVHHVGRIYTDYNPTIHFQTAFGAAPGSENFQIGMSIKHNVGVGIGTDSPKLKLHVHQNNSNAAFAHFTNTSTGYNSDQGLSVGLDSDENAVMYHYGSKNIRFATSNTQHMMLRSTGQLGIGTALNHGSDSKKLTVVCDSVGDGIHIANRENLYPAASTGYSDLRYSFYDYTTGGYTRGGEAIIRAQNRNAFQNLRTTDLVFLTSGDDGDPASGEAQERLRITSDGYLKLSGRNVQESADGDKLMRVYQPSRTDSEQDVLLLQSYNTSSDNKINIGGGDSSFNSATQISLRTAEVNTLSGYESLRVSYNGNMTNSTGSWRAASEKYVNTLHMPQAHEGYSTAPGHNALSVCAEMWHQSHVRGTGHLTTELFSTRMGGNGGMFIFVEVWFSCAVSDFQGYQALWANANRTSSNNFTINNTGQEGNQLGSNTGNYFDLTYASSGSNNNQRLTWKVVTSFPHNYVRCLYKTTAIGHDYFHDFTVIR